MSTFSGRPYLIASRDPYNYQTLADLFFSWARRSGVENETATYLAKAEEVIALGLKSVREREGLWLVSANIQKWLGNAPAALDMLKKAQASPVAAYMLGRALLHNGDAAAAIAVLEPRVSNDPDAWRSAIVLAKAMLLEGRNYRQAIAVLRLSDLHGMRDPRYIATLGGLLFLDGEFSEAKRLFAGAYDFSLDERTKVEFRPKASGSNSPHTWKGEVVEIRFGNIQVLVPGYPPIFCPGNQC